MAGTLLTAKNSVDKSLTKHRPKFSNQCPFTLLKDLYQNHTICEVNNNFEQCMVQAVKYIPVPDHNDGRLTKYCLIREGKH